jgi:serine protease Do
MMPGPTLASLGLVAALFACTGVPAPASYLGSVVEVRVDDGSLVPAIATGWVGPCGLVVTVAHALDGQRGVAVVPASGRPHPAQIVARDDGPDLALLRVDGLQAPRLALAAGGVGSLRIVVRRDHKPEVLDVQLHRRVGISIDERGGSHRRSGLEFTPVLADGDSGAPILDVQGRVVGVAFATNNTLAYASATSELRALLAREVPMCPSG